MLKGKHIVVGITGSIAAYKACTLIRTFIKKGAEATIIIVKLQLLKYYILYYCKSERTPCVC